MLVRLYYNTPFFIISCLRDKISFKMFSLAWSITSPFDVVIEKLDKFVAGSFLTSQWTILPSAPSTTSSWGNVTQLYPLSLSLTAASNFPAPPEISHQTPPFLNSYLEKLEWRHYQGNLSSFSSALIQNTDKL